MFDAVVHSTRRMLALAGVAAALVVGGLPHVAAYTSALVRTSGNGAFQVVSAQPSGGKVPFVYCTASDVNVARGASDSVGVTCNNGFAYNVTLTITFSDGSSGGHPPTYNPSSSLSLTVPANGQASSSIAVTTSNNTTRATYTMSYTASTSGTQGVTISGIAFTSAMTVS
jgi:hypothetical protein